MRTKWFTQSLVFSNYFLLISNLYYIVKRHFYHVSQYTLKGWWSAVSTSIMTGPGESVSARNTQLSGILSMPTVHTWAWMPALSQNLKEGLFVKYGDWLGKKIDFPLYGINLNHPQITKIYLLKWKWRGCLSARNQRRLKLWQRKFGHWINMLKMMDSTTNCKITWKRNCPYGQVGVFINFSQCMRLLLKICSAHFLLGREKKPNCPVSNSRIRYSTVVWPKALRHHSRALTVKIGCASDGSALTNPLGCRNPAEYEWSI